MNPCDFPEVSPPAPALNAVFVYILATITGAYYVGSAKDVSCRIRLHCSGRGAKFTEDNGAVKLVYVEGPLDLRTAIQREFQLKGWSRAKKEALIHGNHATLRHLSQSRD
ncbi:MAG: nuclease superfamily protein [Verrucomicrobia bacterium]|nr:nuclease superfamily protein [Verrucomicrobiota bacterium]